MSQDLYDPESFRQAGHKLVDLLADYLADALAGRLPVLPDLTPREVMAFYQGMADTPPERDDIPQWLEHTTRDIIARSVHYHHPGYIGHQVAPPLPLAALAELIAGVLNQGGGIFEMGQAATVIERQTVRLLCDLAGLPEGSDGIFTSGGNLGNFTALLAARNHAGGGSIWRSGVATTPLVMVTSNQCHYSISRAVAMLGLGADSLIATPVDSQFRMRKSDVRNAVERATSAGKKVAAVIAGACTTATGSYDHLREIGEYCRENNIWFHVDGAHGASVLFSEKYKDRVDGIALADSIVWDTHKMLFMPTLATAVLFRDIRRNYAAFNQEASYLFSHTNDEPDFDLALRTMECTKKMLAVKLWLCIRAYGIDALGQLVDKSMDLAQEFAALLLRQSDFEIIHRPMSNILCFRHIPSPQLTQEEMNSHQELLRNQIIKDGRFYLVQTKIDQKVYLRVSIMNVLTSLNDLSQLIAAIRSISDKSKAGRG